MQKVKSLLRGPEDERRGLRELPLTHTPGYVGCRTERQRGLREGHPIAVPPLRIRKKCRGGSFRSNSMANNSETRGSTPSTREDQSGSSTQGNRGSQAGTTSHTGGSQSSQQHSGTGTGSTPTGRPDDKDKKGSQPGGTGSGTQHSGSGSESGVNAGSTGTSGGQISPHSPTTGQAPGRSGGSGSSAGGDRNK